MKINNIEEQKMLLEQSREKGESDKIREISGSVARALVDDGQPEAAIPYFDEAIHAAEEANNIHGMANNLGNKGVALVRLKQYDQAREIFEQVEQIAVDLNEPALQCDALMQKSIMHLDLQRGDLVHKDLMDALVIAESLQDLSRQMKIQALMGHNHFNIASFDEAAKFFTKALELAEESENKRAQAGYHHNLGNVYYAANVPNEGIHHLTKAVDIFRSLGDQRGEMQALLRLVKSYADDDQPVKTYDCAKEGLTLAKILQDQNAINSFNNLLIATSSHLGKHEETLELIQEALVDAKERDDTERVLNLYISQGNTNYELDRFDDARKAYLEGLDASIRIQNWELRTRILGRLSAVEAEMGNLDQSIEHAKQALESAEKVGNRHLIGEQYMMLAFAARDQGDLAKAKSYAELARENFTIIEAKSALEKLNQFIDEL